jgi:hypothetical protein
MQRTFDVKSKYILLMLPLNQAILTVAHATAKILADFHIFKFDVKI